MTRPAALGQSCMGRCACMYGELIGAGLIFAYPSMHVTCTSGVKLIAKHMAACTLHVNSLVLFSKKKTHLY
jgi:hypothetical protein